MPFRPSKWILYTPIAVLPFLAALVLEGRALQESLADRVKSSLDRAGATWAKPAVSGRDVVLSGDAPSAEQMDAAIAAVVGTYGVRSLHSQLRVVEPAPAPAAPAVKPLSGLGGFPVIERTRTRITQTARALDTTLGFVPGVKDLPFALVGVAYDINSDEPGEKGGSALAAEDADSDDLILAEDQTSATMIAPTVAAFRGGTTPQRLSGTWDETRSSGLSVSVKGTAIKSVLGSDTSLASDGKGNWSLELGVLLRPGTYDVLAEATDKTGRPFSDQTSGELVITPQSASAMQRPTVIQYRGEDPPHAIRGTWDRDASASLEVAIPGTPINASLGRNGALTSDGNGNWMLEFSGLLPPGTYEVVVVTADASGRRLADDTSGEIQIKAKAAAASRQ